MIKYPGKGNLRKVYFGSQFKDVIHHCRDVLGQQLEAVGHIVTAHGYLHRTVDLKEVNCTIGSFFFHIMYARCLCVNASSHTYGYLYRLRYLYRLSTGIIGAP